MYFQVFRVSLFSDFFPIAPARSSFSFALRDLKAASVGPFFSLEIKCFESSCNN